MNPDWRTFLTAQGVGGRAAPPAPAGGPDAPAACIRFDLSHLGLIAVRGADAAAFLQGQLTTDMRASSDTHTRLGGHCSPKGRLLALFRVMRLADETDLELPRERVPDLIARLRRFVLRAKITLEDVSDGPIRIGCSGSGADHALGPVGLALPEQDNDLAVTDGVAVLRLPAPVPRFELIGACAQIAAIWDALAPACATGDADGWALLDICAGLPSVYTATAWSMRARSARTAMHCRRWWRSRRRKTGRSSWAWRGPCCAACRRPMVSPPTSDNR